MNKRIGGASEYDIALGTLEYLNGRSSGEATIEELVKALPNHVALSREDLEASETRPNERVWEQRVRNIVSHKDSPNNFLNLGYLEQTRAGSLAITDAGRDYLKRELG
jgi:hypothetical protein